MSFNAVLYPFWEASTHTKSISTWISNSEGTIIWQDSCPVREEFSFATKTAAVKGLLNAIVASQVTSISILIDDRSVLRDLRKLSRRSRVTGLSALQDGQQIHGLLAQINKVDFAPFNKF